MSEKQKTELYKIVSNKDFGQDNDLLFTSKKDAKKWLTEGATEGIQEDLVDVLLDMGEVFICEVPKERSEAATDIILDARQRK